MGAPKVQGRRGEAHAPGLLEADVVELLGQDDGLRAAVDDDGEHVGTDLAGELAAVAELDDERLDLTVPTLKAHAGDLTEAERQLGVARRDCDLGSRIVVRERESSSE